MWRMRSFSTSTTRVPVLAVIAVVSILTSAILALTVSRGIGVVASLAVAPAGGSLVTYGFLQNGIPYKK